MLSTSYSHPHYVPQSPCHSSPSNLITIQHCMGSFVLPADVTGACDVFGRRDHRLVRGCHTISPRRLLRRRSKMWGSVGGDRNTWSGRWRRRRWWNTWKRKGAETYGRGCPAGGPRCVETMVPGTCFSSCRAMFEARRCPATRGCVPCGPGVIPD
jgi:hypothetical protein